MVIDESTTLPSASVSAASDDGLAVPALTIIWHADVSRVGAMHSLGDLGQGESISLSRRSPEFQAFTGDVLPLDDPYLSRQPCLSLVRTKNGVRLVPVGTETSIFLDGKPLRSEVPLSLPDLAAGRMVTVGRRNLLCLHTTCLDSYSEPAGNLGLLGNSDAIRGVRKDILSVADMDLPVLIRGATGTGKELTAAAIAKHSRRASKPFVAINMGAVPAGVAEAELFGHQRGAFTGATESRGGYFGEADGGTLLLDEIGLASPAVQAALLRTIETGEIWPVGAKRGRRVDVRIIAATDVPLEDRCESGRFSAPLFQRLKIVQIRLPLLRERRQDIGVLFLHFVRQFLGETGELGKLGIPVTEKRPWLLAEAMTSVALAAWSGNVRQLRNFAAQLVVANRGANVARLTSEMLASLEQDRDTPGDSGGPDDKTHGRLSREQLLDALERNDFQPARAARELGVSRTTIYARMKSDPDLLRARKVEPATKVFT